MENFTPFSALIGGIIIGLAASFLLFLNGRICGVSGIFGGFLHFKKGESLWRFSFVAGLLCGGVLLFLYHPQSMAINIPYSGPTVMLAGLLVGIGTRMGSGCTSGHGICGVSRLAPRSLVATAVFLVSGSVAAIAVNQFMGGQA